MRFDLIAFDADDTLWHNETLYSLTQEKFQALLSSYGFGPEQVDQELYTTEMGNLPFFGYGIKSYILSMIETVVRLTGGRVTASEIQQIVDFAKEMVQAEVELLENVQDTVAKLADKSPLMLITKGDLLDQERKLDRSGLLDSFQYIEIVSEKDSARYAALLARHRVEPERFLMVGNSLRSDILPVVAIGGQAVYIPYHLTWAHENEVDPDQHGKGYYELEHIGQLPELLEKLEREA
jgi:putative hydrolase of the HAD superfamily